MNDLIVVIFHNECLFPAKGIVNELWRAVGGKSSFTREQICPYANRRCCGEALKRSKHAHFLHWQSI